MKSVFFVVCVAVFTANLLSQGNAEDEHRRRVTQANDQNYLMLKSTLKDSDEAPQILGQGSPAAFEAAEYP